ncbi:MAG: outer membrane protein assembly factor BamE [Rhodospirillales bacterium]|nr:outer membrane protein assembly factor BamE [Rhodospirillales bacterium]
MKRFFPSACAVLVFLLIAACTPMERVHGNIVETAQIEQIKKGVSTRSDVLRVFGSPATIAPFDDSVWYYIGQKTEKRGIFDAQVTDGKIVAVSFDESGVVRDLRVTIGTPEDVPTVARKTPVTGTRTSPLQEFFGNLGKYNPKTPE